jgi:hypothetical protein
MTAVADRAVGPASSSGTIRDSRIERRVDAGAANVELYELGRQHALAAVAATASLLLQAGQPECATTLLAGIANAHATLPAPHVSAVGAGHRPPVVGDDAAGTMHRRTPDLGQLVSMIEEHLKRPGEARHNGDPAGGPARSRAELCRTGDMWRVTFAGVSAHLPHRKGIGDLAVLLARPGREIAALDLAAGAAPGPAMSAAPGVDGLGVSGDLGERLDARARASYTARIRELQADLDDADAVGDMERSARAQREFDFLTRELSAAYGLRGPRRTGDPAEKARSAVTMRIRASLVAIREAHPALGVHLHRTVSTGRLCSYNPDEPVTWQVTS